MHTVTAPRSRSVSMSMIPCGLSESQGLGFVSAGKNSCDIVELTPNANYRVEWWHIDNGGWQENTVHKTDGA